jgi:hypothetical protein
VQEPGEVESKHLKALEDDMFTKLRLETRSKNIDEKALAHPNDAAGAEAVRQLRVERMKQAILDAKVELIEHSCPRQPKCPESEASPLLALLLDCTVLHRVASEYQAGEGR